MIFSFSANNNSFLGITFVGNRDGAAQTYKLLLISIIEYCQQRLYEI